MATNAFAFLARASEPAIPASRPVADRTQATSTRPLPLPSRAISRRDDPAGREPSASSTGEGTPRSAGHPLPGVSRSFFEQRFGRDLGHVRVVRDHLADSFNARAVTIGHDIHIARGEDATHHGNGLLAHELTHVIQQQPGAGGDPVTRVWQRHDAEAEAHAAEMASLTGSPWPAIRVATPPGAVLQGQPKARKSPKPPGGNILYIGLNNYKPEVEALESLYAGTSVSITKVTLSEAEKSFALGKSKVDLTTTAGIDAFAQSLGVDASRVKRVADLIGAQADEDRDDLAHAVQIYARTELDGQDRMSRVILSGHSYGYAVYGSSSHDVGNSHLKFDALVVLQQIFPIAAGQVKHLIVAGCLAGKEATIREYYKKAYPNLVTFSGWTSLCPTGPGAAAAITAWGKLTDRDPTSLPQPGTGRSNWASGLYQGDQPAPPATAMADLRADEARFNEYLVGTNVDADAHHGWLTEYYGRARGADLRVSEIVGADHDYAHIHAEQALRLRYWSTKAQEFWRIHHAAIERGYGTAKAPAYGTLSRSAAVAAVHRFGAETTATGSDRDVAAALLRGLLDLDPKVLPE